MIESYIIFILTIAFIFSCCYIDDEHLDDNDYIEDHKSRFVQRLIFVLVIVCYNYKLGIGAAFLFAAIFDQVLNWFRDKPLFHLGMTAYWDRFFNRKYYRVLYVVVKFLALAISLFCFLNNFYTFDLWEMLK